MPPLAGGRLSRQIEELEKRARAGPSKLPVEACWVRTPLKAEVWQEMLRDHPDRRLVGVVVRGIREGFRVGFQGDPKGLKPARQNMVSVRQHPEVVQEYLARELEAGRIVEVGHSTHAAAMGIHCSPFGVIPKKGKAGRWRLIVDLSAPDGGSVNDGISAELASLSYMSVDDVMREVLRRGRGTLMAKADIKQAYRNLPVHPVDRELLGVQWRDRLFVDCCLPFGLRSAPLLFTVTGDLLQWVMEKRGVSWIRHYIDDFITVGNPGESECQRHIRIVKEVCEEAGMPTEPEKEEGPMTELVFLGMELDSRQLVIRLPEEKLQRMRSTVERWRGMKSCKKRDLLSIIGVLSHASKAIRAGRSFLRRLIDLSTGVRQLHRHIRLNREARADLEWWHQFGQDWNGVAMMWCMDRAKPGAVVTTDASGAWCGDKYCPPLGATSSSLPPEVESVSSIFGSFSFSSCVYILPLSFSQHDILAQLQCQDWLPQQTPTLTKFLFL